MPIIAPHYNKAKQNAFISFFKRDRYLIKTPGWLKRLYPGCLWDMPKGNKTLYLSFDDGPHPAITPFVLDQLKKYNAKATFFCIGDNVKKYPETFQQVIAEGHSIGNHTMHHINGWKNNDDVYLKDIEEAGQYIHSNLFRPPYGRISKAQIKKLQALLFINHSPLSIIMWNILAGDWDATVSPQKCFERIKRKISDGDIIVFHDSEKAFERMEYALPKVLEHFASLGYSFKSL